MSRQARQRRRRHNRAGPTRFLLIGGGILVTALIVGAIAAVGYVLNVSQSAPAITSLHPIIGGGSSQVYAADGTRLGFIQSDELRTPVTWSQIPADLRNATVAIEDQRFYKNNGVDLTGIFRAAVKDLTHGKALQGGSTITMQLMRNLYLGGDQHTITPEDHRGEAGDRVREAPRQALDPHQLSEQRPVRHARWADRDRRAGGVADLLRQTGLAVEPGAVGAARRAAAGAFAVQPVPRRIRRARATQRGARTRWPNCTTSRRRAAASAEAAPLEVKRGYFYSQRKEDFFFEYVREQLVKRYGAATVAQGGLKVLHDDRPAHAERGAQSDRAGAQRARRPGVGDRHDQPRQRRHRGDGRVPELRGVAVQPRRRRATASPARRSRRSCSPTRSRAASTRTPPYYISHTLAPGWLTGYPTYEVKTFGGEQNGTINLVQATLKSDNTVYAQLAADLGESTVTEMARKMGVTSPLHSYAAEALGGLTLGVTPLEMANVYATLADGGWRNSPIAITKVVFPDGHVDNNWGKPHRVKVLSEAVTAEETQILKENVESGTAARSAISCPTAAKTGTTSELVDAWLDGYTPNYATAVWMGYPDQTRLDDRRPRRAPAGWLPARRNLARVHELGRGRQDLRAVPARQGIDLIPAVLRQIRDHRPVARNARIGKRRIVFHDRIDADESTETRRRRRARLRRPVARPRRATARTCAAPAEQACPERGSAIASAGGRW